MGYGGALLARSTSKKNLSASLIKNVPPFCINSAPLGVERTPDPDTLGNRYAKLDPRYAI